MKKNQKIWKTAFQVVFLLFITAICPLEGICALKPNAKPAVRKVVKEGEKYVMPDFAFPENVSKDAVVKLKTSLDSGDNLGAISAMMQVIVARNAVSPDSFDNNISLADSVARLLPQPYSAVVALIEAKMYSESGLKGNTAVERALQLVMEARAGFAQATSMPIEDVSLILSKTVDAERAGVTVGDFMTAEAARILYKVSGGAHRAIIPFFGNDTDISNPKVKCGIYAGELIDGLLRDTYSGGHGGRTVFAVLEADALDYVTGGDFLIEWTRKLKDVAQAGFLISKGLSNPYENINESEEYLKIAQKWLKLFPSSAYTKMVKSAVDNAKRPEVSLKLPWRVATGTKVIAELSTRNVGKMYLHIYKIPLSSFTRNTLSRKVLPKGSSLVETVGIQANSGLDLKKEEIVLPDLKRGYYLCVPMMSSKPLAAGTGKIKGGVVINVSSTGLVMSKSHVQENSAKVFAVDAHNQKPLKNVDISLYNMKSPSKVEHRGKTSADGSFAIPKGNWWIKASNGEDVLWEEFYCSYFKPGDEESISVKLLTDLSVYRPGETVRFAGICAKGKDNRGELIEDTEVRLSLRDVNNVEIDTLMLVSDGYGRFSGSFRIPDGRLNGRWKIAASMPKLRDKPCGYGYFGVEEYKIPGFSVTVERLPDETEDALKFAVKALTWSGMPIGESKLDYSISWYPGWDVRGGNEITQSYSGTAMTNTDGSYTLELPTCNLDMGKYSRGLFDLSVSVTSPSGETCKANALRFFSSETYSLSPRITGKTPVENDSVVFNVKVRDRLGFPGIKEVGYIIKPEGKPEFEKCGNFVSPRLSVPFSGMPYGKYDLIFTLGKDTVRTSTIIYSPSEKTPPPGVLLWIPENKVRIAEGERSVGIPVGSSFNGNWVLCQISDGTDIKETRWVECNDTILRLHVEAPGNDGRVYVKFGAMHDFTSAQDEVTLIPESQLNKPKVEAVTFRDKINAGDGEKWTFRFSGFNRMTEGIAAMATMSDMALNAIRPFEWSVFFSKGRWFNRTNLLYGLWDNRKTSFTMFDKDMEKAQTGYGLPGFQTWGYPLAGQIWMTRSMRKYAGSNVAVSMDYSDNTARGVKTESVELSESKASAEVEEVMADGMANFVVGGISDSDGDSGSDFSDVKLRPVSMPSAFFMPFLNSSPSGELEVGFTVPDFNTEWQFQLLGYDRDLDVASLCLKSMSAKSVMVKTSYPRYVRTGDSVVVSAMLFNNTEAASELRGRIEIISQSDGKVIASKELEPVSVPASGNITVYVDFDVPDNTGGIIIKSYAKADGHTDGEQVAVPVLPSYAPTVVSLPFWIPAGENSIELKLPKLGANDNVMLKFTSNPIWEAMLALPSITNGDLPSVTSLMKSLYGYSVASRIAENDSFVREVIEKAVSHSDSIKGNLAGSKGFRNCELAATPWINDAESETERIRSLGELLEQGVAESKISESLERVGKLQNHDGGWSWCPDMPSNYSITVRTLKYFSMMKSSGFIPAGAKEMIRNGLEYADSKVLEEYRRNNRKFDVLDMMEYFLVRNSLSERKGTNELVRLKKEVVKSVIENWEEFSPVDKAFAALFIYGEPEYAGVANAILESLRQNALKTSMGWSYDNVPGYRLETAVMALRAFATISKRSDAVDGLRQWILLQKQVQDWGSYHFAAMIVDALLTSGTNWSAENPLPRIKVGKTNVTLSSNACLPGSYVADLSPRSSSGKKLVISREGADPAWGGVMIQKNLPVSDVEASSTPDLKVTKEVFALETSEGASIPLKRELRVGDRVRVVINVESGREMDFVTVTDNRSSCLEPVGALSGYRYLDGFFGYREIKDAKTMFFIERLPKGTSVLSYECNVEREGMYSLGETTVQCLYEPLETAGSGGGWLTVSGSASQD